MQLKVIVFAAIQIVAVLANPVEVVERQDLPIHTATRVFHTIVHKSPFLVDKTSTIVWTESSSITDTPVSTAAPSPTIGY
ncbi:hypothetical protein BDN70DRAFT_933783 [Pholiota conissans]|uniref:Uncharacterized protein n=1 Tax=Pholiota conissans TaxID=109636 RepID=A0A9P6CZR3_9AGAR|nr:hypothetical protein BDN70DRAFT_933783 [Pholiota conissans]